MPTENDARPCTHFGCMGTQRFSETGAESGQPGWDCSEDREHFEPQPVLDFSDEGRASRIDSLLNDLRLLKEEAANLRNPGDAERLQQRTRLLIAGVQAERNHIKFRKS